MKYYNWFAKYIPGLKDVEQQNVICIFHNEENPSLSINLDKGMFHCHTCEAKGDIYAFVMKTEHCTFPEAKKKITGDYKVPVLSEAEVVDAHRILLSKKFIMDLLLLQRGWSLNTITRFKLGWNDYSKRVYIPIYDDKGQLKNIRKYLVGQKATKQNPKIHGVKGHNECYFFPIKNLLKEKFIMVMAGEPDTILACQLGYNAGTFTTGEGSFNRNLLPLFKDKLVYICFDKDLKGLRALKNIGKAIAEYAKEVKRIDLPF